MKIPVFCSVVNPKTCDTPKLDNLLDNHLLFAPHVTKTLAQASQSIHALKVLKTSGLPIRSLTSVCQATLVARLLYAAPCWWGSISEADKLRLQATLRRAVTRPRTHNLRARGHPYVLPLRDRFTQANFIRRMLFTKL